MALIPFTAFPWHPICISNKGKTPPQVLQSRVSPFQAPLVSRSPVLPSSVYPSLSPTAFTKPLTLLGFAYAVPSAPGVSLLSSLGSF